MNTQRPRVLAIDDDPLFRSLMSSMLAKDFFVSVSSSGSEGFYRAVEHPPDLAIIDIQMPGWDGLQTLKAFRSHPRLRGIQIVILTSDASKETVMAAIKGGANDYVIKTSLSKETLCKKLNDLLESAQHTAQNEPHDAEECKTIDDAEEVSDRDFQIIDKPMLKNHTSDDRNTESDLQELIDSWE